MPTDPSDPKSPNLYQTTSTPANKGGGGGIFFAILLVLVLGGGGAYYFLGNKSAAPAPVASATPTPTATPKPVPSATPTGYSPEQRKQYIQTAIDAFKAARTSKLQPFTEAFAAFSSAGGLGAAGLTSKDAITARRDLIKKCLAANDDYTAFIKNQEAAYTAELKKTPLTPNDVEVESSYTGAKMPTDKIVQLRALQGDLLKNSDQMLAYLDSKFGAWSVNAEKHIVFKKAADGAGFNALAKTYGEQATALNKLRDEVNVNPDATDPTVSSAAATGAATTPAPAASAAPSAAP